MHKLVQKNPLLAMIQAQLADADERLREYNKDAGIAIVNALKKGLDAALELPELVAWEEPERKLDAVDQAVIACLDQVQASAASMALKPPVLAPPCDPPQGVPATALPPACDCETGGEPGNDTIGDTVANCTPGMPQPSPN